MKNCLTVDRLSTISLYILFRTSFFFCKSFSLLSSINFKFYLRISNTSFFKVARYACFYKEAVLICLECSSLFLLFSSLWNSVCSNFFPLSCLNYDNHIFTFFTSKELFYLTVSSLMILSWLF